MKKILIILVSFIICILFSTNIFASVSGCDYNSGSTVGSMLDSCLKGSKLVDGIDVNIESGFGNQIQKWINNISIFLGILAVGSIVFGAFMLTISTGDDEKIKKAKDIVKWGILGFLGIIFATAIVSLIIKIMYSI